MNDLQKPSEVALKAADRILAIRTTTPGQESLDELVGRIRADAPWLTDADGPLLRSTLINVLLLEQLDEYLQRAQPLDSRGRPRTVMAKSRGTLQNTVIRQLEALGLTPGARAEIARLDRDGTSPAARKRAAKRRAAADRARSER